MTKKNEAEGESENKLSVSLCFARIGANITLSGDDGNANIGQYINMNGSGTNRINDASGEGVELYSTNYTQLNYDNSGYVYVQSTGVFLESGSYYANLYSSNGQFAVSNAFSAADTNFTVNQDGNVNASGYGSFSDVYITNASNSYILYANGTQVYGDGSFTYDYGSSQTLTAGNLTTENANFSGYVNLTGHTAGNLLTTDMGGNVVDSNISFGSGDTLTVGNANIVHNLTAGNLQVTSLATVGALLFTSDIGGNVTENSNLYYNSTSNTLNTVNLTASGDVLGNTVSANNFSNTQIAFANLDHTLVGDSSFTYNSGTSTLSALQ